MNSRQNTIKNVAMVFATLLAIAIISVIVYAIYSIVSWISPSSNGKSFEGIDYNETFDDGDISKLVVENSFGKLIIKQGDTFEVTAENVLEDFSCELKKGELTIEHTSPKNFNINNFSNTSITITVPGGTDLDSISISTGVDSCTINDISTSDFVFEVGVGDVNISGFNADKATIEGGVGNIDITDSNFDNLELECGVGNASINGSMENCVIDSGVGDVKLDIDGSYDEYDIDISAGIGTIKVDGKRYEDDARLNKGADNKIEVNGGVGDVTINFK